MSIPAQAPLQAVDCRRCPLSAHRTKVVWGEGPTPAPVMLLAEAPGAWEDKKARPMVGQAGKLLNELLSSVGMPRETVYLANVLKCRPPENKIAPWGQSILDCEPWLLQEISEVKPKVIVALGLTAGAILFPGLKAWQMCGLARQVGDTGVLAVGCYHPSALARDRENDVLRRRMVAALTRAAKLGGIL